MAMHPEGPVLVTGAAGFIGSAVARRLLTAGVEVRGLVRDGSSRERIAGLPIACVAGDIRDRDAVSRAMAGCTAVVHLAGPSAWPLLDSPDVLPVIVGGTQCLLRLATRHAVRRIVHVSTAAVLGPARNPSPRTESSPPMPVPAGSMPYLEAKRLAEQVCRDCVGEGADIVIVNPGEVYGPDDRGLVTAGNLLSLVRSPIPIVCRGGTSVAHVEDVADGIVRAWIQGRRGERYLLGGENVTHRQLAETLLAICGRRARPIVLPNALVRTSAWMARRLGLPFPIPFAAVPYATAYWHLSAEKADRELGTRFRPARETLCATLRWLHAAGHKFSFHGQSELASPPGGTVPSGTTASGEFGKPFSSAPTRTMEESK